MEITISKFVSIVPKGRGNSFDALIAKAVLRCNFSDLQAIMEKLARCGQPDN